MKFFQRRPDQQQREAYRVSGDDSRVAVFLAVDDEPAPVALIDLSAGGVAVEVSPELGRRLHEGAEVLTRIDAEGRSVFARAAVRSNLARPDTTRLGLAFLDRSQVWAQVSPDLWRYFNRREAFRQPVSGADTGLVRARVSWGDNVRDDVIHDLSTTGISLRVSTRDGVVFPESELVKVHFSLPADPEPFDLGVVLAHDTSIRGSRRVGFCFDETASPRLPHDQERILQYILARQRLALQQRDETVA